MPDLTYHIFLLILSPANQKYHSLTQARNLGISLTLPHLSYLLVTKCCRFCLLTMFQILPPFLHHFHHLPPVLEQLISQSQVPSLSFSLPSLHVRLFILNKISDLTPLKFEIPECPPHPFIALSISPHCLACHAKP